MTVAVTLAALLFPTSALGRPGCTTREEVVRHLRKGYGEAPVAMGLASNGGVTEVLASSTGRTWTIIITMPDGTACMIAAGSGWETLPIKPEGASM